MVDGAAIAYRTWGEPGGRGIVLVHRGSGPGFAQSREMWPEEHAAMEHRVFGGLRGCGTIRTHGDLSCQEAVLN